MPLPIYTSAAFTNGSGVSVASNASVEVRRESDGSLINIFEDRDGETQITQPGFQADLEGRFEFYAEPAAEGWEITVTAGGDTHTLNSQFPQGGVFGIPAGERVLNTEDGVAQSVDSVEDLRASNFRASLERLWLSGYNGVGTPGGGPLYRDSDDTTSEDNGGTVFVDADGVRWKADSGFVIAEPFAVTVGSGGNYETQAEAFDALSGLSPTSSSEGFLCTVNLLSGYQMEEQILANSVDFSWIKVQSENSVVIIDRASLTQSFTPDGVGSETRLDRSAYAATNGGKSPAIGCVFEMNETGDDPNNADRKLYHGLFCASGSYGKVLPDCGFNNVSGRAIFAWVNSRIDANGCVCTGASERSIDAAQNSQISCQFSTLTEAGSFGIRAFGGSIVYARGSDCSDSGNNSVDARYGSTIDFFEGIATNSGNHALNAINSSKIEAENSNLSGASSRAVNVADCSVVECSDSDLSGFGARGINAFGCSTVNCNDSNLSGGNGDRTVSASTGSTISVRGADLSGGLDIFCSIGSFVTITGAISPGQTNISENTLTSDGVIFE